MNVPDECDHPEKSREYDEGNYVPGFGWEQWPGWYCHDCNEMLDEEEVTYAGGTDPDFEIKYEKENPQ